MHTAARPDTDAPRDFDPLDLARNLRERADMDGGKRSATGDRRAFTAAADAICRLAAECDEQREHTDNNALLAELVAVEGREWKRAAAEYRAEAEGYVDLAAKLLRKIITHDAEKRQDAPAPPLG